MGKPLEFLPAWLDRDRGCPVCIGAYFYFKTRETQTMNIGIAGLGTVGAEVARQLIKTPSNRAEHMMVTAVSARTPDRDRGFSMNGIDFVDDPVALTARKDVDCVIELIGGDEGPALDLIEAAIANGKNIVTANKALLSKHGARLVAMAEKAGLDLAGEAAVAGGIPALKLLREGLAANEINCISGILNGTCNFILSDMEKTGRDFDDVLKEAQALGYAEADPSFDIDGIDAAHKLSLLSGIAFGIKPDLSAIDISGIRNVTALDIACAAELGLTIKLLAVCEKSGNDITSSVRPTLVPSESGLAKIDGATNAVEVIGSPVGSVMVTGPGAGAGATASAVLGDLIEIASGRAAPFFGIKAADLAEGGHDAGNGEISASHYMRLMAEDRPGVLADVTKILSEVGASVASILQHEDGADEIVPIILTTHEMKVQAFEEVRNKIGSLDAVVEAPKAMVIMGSSK
jgi:homoserine dehydrogenase